MKVRPALTLISARGLALLLCMVVGGTAVAEITGMITEPGGDNSEVQFHSDGVFEGDSTLTFSTSTKRLTAQEISATYGILGGTGTFTGALAASTLNTGQGANELYDMDQNVQTTDSPTFSSLTLTYGLTAGTGTFTSLTSGRVVVAGASGLLQDFAGFTHNGTTLTVGGLSVTGNTVFTGSVSGAGASFTSLTDSGLTSGRFVLAGTGGLLGDDADFSHNGTTATLTGVSATNVSVSGLVTGAESTWSGTLAGTNATFSQKVGINSAIGTSTLTVGGLIESSAGGFKFPDGTTQITAAAAAAATQAEMEAASSITAFSSPGRQQYHPGVAKAWAVWNGTGTINITASHNISSITDNGTGDYTINFTTSFSSVNYSCDGWAKEFDSTANTTMRLIPAKQTVANTWAAGSYRVNTIVDGGTLVDAIRAGINCFGDQ